jgi:hypothetical protein
MGRAEGLINKLNATLNRVGPSNRKAYKRVTTRTGGDALIGRPGAVSHSDTLMNPQPFYHPVGRIHVPGGHAHMETVIDSNNKAKRADDYQFIISPSAISASELETNDVTIVLKADDGSEEVLRLLDQDAPTYQGTNVVYICYYRSVTRP